MNENFAREYVLEKVFGFDQILYIVLIKLYHQAVNEGFDQQLMIDSIIESLSDQDAGPSNFFYDQNN